MKTVVPFSIKPFNNQELLSAMATLSPATRAVLNRLKAFKPKYFGNSHDSIWHHLPVVRRAAVLVILFESRTVTNDITLSAVLTRRGTGMSSFSGQVALPGGKADFETEDPFQVARREAYEEIALPLDNKNDGGTTIENVSTMPSYLARNMLAVMPAIAYIHSPPTVDELPLAFRSDGLPSVLHPTRDQIKHGGPADESAEVAEIFSVPLYDLLACKLPNGTPWYEGKPADWGGLKMILHWYSILRINKKVGEPSHFT